MVGALGVAFAKPSFHLTGPEEALQAAADGRLTLRIHGAYPLDKAAEAHADLEGRRTIGAVQLVP